MVDKQKLDNGFLIGGARWPFYQRLSPFPLAIRFNLFLCTINVSSKKR
jgi:hypothetical protein